MDYSSERVEKLLEDLKQNDIEICHKSLQEIENLDRNVISQYYDRIANGLLARITKPPLNANLVNEGIKCMLNCIWKGPNDVYEQCKHIFKFINSNLILIGIAHASPYLDKIHFIYSFLVFAEQRYLSFPDDARKKMENVISVLASSTTHYSSALRDAIPVALKLSHLGSRSLQAAVFRLLRALYKILTASTEKPFLNCTEKTIQSLLEVLSKDCAQVYHQRKDRDVLVRDLITQPTSWFYNIHDKGGIVESKEACLKEAGIILNYLHLISQANVKSIKWLLSTHSNLSASISALLLYSGDEIIEGCVLSLLDSILSQIRKPENIEAPNTDTYFGSKLKALLKTIEFIEAVLSEDEVKLREILSKSLEVVNNDHRNRNLEQWCDYLSTTDLRKCVLNALQNIGTQQQFDVKRRRMDAEESENDETKIKEVPCSERQKLVHLFYFTVEVLPILLAKCQQYPSEIHRHAILLLIDKLLSKMPKQIVESTLMLKIDGKFLLYTLCKLIKDAIMSGDGETSAAAKALNESLLKKYSSVYLPLAREYDVLLNDSALVESLLNAETSGSEKPSSVANIAVILNHDLTEISRGLSEACALSDKELVMTSLEKNFLALKNVFRSSDSAIITSRRLQTSGLIRALTDCLAASSCTKWSESIPYSTSQHHFDYLLQRRSLFQRLFHKSRELETLFQLLVETAEENGCFPIYLPELLFKMKEIESSCNDVPVENGNSEEARVEFLLRDRNLMTGANNSVIKIMEHWINLAPRRGSQDLIANEFHFSYAYIDLRCQRHSTREKISSTKGPLLLRTQYGQTLNELLINTRESIFHNWYTVGRRRIFCFIPFDENKCHFIKLQPETDDHDNDYSETNCLQMSVFEWLGTDCGRHSCFLNPALKRLIRICSFQAGSNEIDIESDSFVGRNEIHNQNHMEKLAVGSEDDMHDEAILEGKKMGSRLVIDLGLDLIPSAYCLCCLYDTERKRPITNWCLQASNNGTEWTNLSVHKNDRSVRGKNLVIPLQLEDASSNSEKGYRLFRILDLSPISKQRRMQVCGLDFFGTIVGIHQQLLDSPTLTGVRNIPEPDLSSTYLTKQMKALKRGTDFIPVTYEDLQYPAYLHPAEDVQPASEAFTKLFCLANCVCKKTKKGIEQLRFKLVLRDGFEHTIDWVEIDDFNIPILRYATRLAEKLVQRNIELRTNLFLEWYFSNDICECVTTTPTTNNYDSPQHLIYLIYQMSSCFNESNSTAEDGSNILDGKSGTSLNFYSQRLCRLIERQLKDSSALGFNMIPRWCDSLEKEIATIIPLDLRLKLFRACAFGFSRTMKWIRDMRIRQVSSLGNRDSPSLPIQPKSVPSSSETPCILNVLRAYHEYYSDAHPKYTPWYCTLKRKVKSVKRNLLDSDDGREFWSSAEISMNRSAESKFKFAFFYEDEPALGKGVTRDFYSELSREFQRKSGFMWLDSSGSQDNSLFIRTNFGLFPAPYPQHLVPLDVLKRFHILGISIARAIQDGFLMDLPLSKPLLKILLSYSVARDNQKNSGFQWLENLEKCGGAKTSPNTFIDHWGLPDRGRKHWLTGLLDVDDFLLLYPHFQTVLPGLLELCQRQRQYFETTNYCDLEDLDEFLVENSKEIFGAVLEDICFSMTVECTVCAKPTTVKLKDTYPWEFTNSGTSDEEHEEQIEYVTNDNYVDYIRRLLEFCLDKGIRIQMKAFVCGFERVFPLKWLSMFTCTEVANLLNGQLADKPWTMQELQSNIEFSGFEENAETVRYFLEILVGLNLESRRMFLRFATGYSTLPLGGWQNLSPKLQVIRMTTSTGRDYPHSAACFHNLYLREYASAEEMRDHLLFAINQTVFLID